MQLTYRGKPYRVTCPTIEVAECSQEGLFLGQRYKLKKINVVTHPPTPSEMVYRGVHYTRSAAQLDTRECVQTMSATG